MNDENAINFVFSLGIVPSICNHLQSKHLIVQCECTSLINHLCKSPLKYVFIDSFHETLDKLEIIKWSEKIGFNVYFTKFSFE